MKTRGGVSRFTAPLILNLSIRWRLMVNFTLRPFYLRKRTPVPIREEVSCVSELAWTFLGKWKTSCPSRDSNTGPSSPQPSHYADQIYKLQQGFIQSHNPTDMFRLIPRPSSGNLYVKWTVTSGSLLTVPIQANRASVCHYPIVSQTVFAEDGQDELKYAGSVTRIKKKNSVGTCMSKIYGSHFNDGNSLVNGKLLASFKKIICHKA